MDLRNNDMGKRERHGEPVDQEAMKRRIKGLDDSIRYRRLFIGGGAIVAASPFLSIMGGGTGDGLDLGWGSIFLIAVGLFAVVYAVVVNRKEQAEKDRLEVELEKFGNPGKETEGGEGKTSE